MFFSSAAFFVSALFFFSSSASFSASARSITLKNSSTVFALRSPLVKFSSIRRTDNLLSTSRCTLSSVFGAAIRKIRLTFSPSNASKSTPSLMTIAARPGLLTASDLQCGMAIPSPIPVVPSSSLAYTPLRYFSTSLIFPLLAINATIASRVSFFPVTLPFKSILSTASKSLIFMLKSSLFCGAKCLLCLHSMCPCRSRGFYSLFCEAKCLLCMLCLIACIACALAGAEDFTPPT